MRAILICPWLRTVTEVDYNGNFRHISQLITPPPEANTRASTCFDLARISNRDAIFVDDEGLFTDWPTFAFAQYGQPLAGRGLIMGSDDEGETVPPVMTLAEATRLTVFGTDEAPMYRPEPVMEVTSFESSEDFVRYLNGMGRGN